MEFPIESPILSFIIILLIVLLSPLVLKRFNIPGIIGLIVSGIIIGPYGLNIIDNNSAVELFSTIGLLYIMFLAGMELDLNEFRLNKYRSITFGILTFIIPLCIGFPVCRYLLGYDISASILIASMFATHTLVSYSIVSKMGITRNPAVAITVGGTILTDIAVLVILAVIINKETGNIDLDYWIRFAITFIVFLLVMFLIIPKISRWFFRKFEGESHSHFIYVLVILFISAFFAEIIGLEPIIGAFMAGLALNRLIPHSSSLMSKIEFIGNSLFIPVFLISVGMVVDLSVIVKGPRAIIVALTLSAVALSSKWLAAFFTQKIFKYTKNQRNLIFGLSSSHAAATLAIIIAGYRVNILDENILNGTIILILITCVVSSFVTESSSRKILIGDNPIIKINKLKFLDENFLLPMTDVENFGEFFKLLLLIKDNRSKKPISLLSIIPNDIDAEKNIVGARNEMEKYAKIANGIDIQVNNITTIDNNRISALTRISREIMADTIIVPWTKSGAFISFNAERFSRIVGTVDKSVMICQIDKPLMTCTRIVLLTPIYTEREAGFEAMMEKIIRLSKELSVSILHIGTEETNDGINSLIDNKKKHSFVTFENIKELFNFHADLENYIKEEDMIIIVMSRKEFISSSALFDNIPTKIERNFKDNIKIAIYPYQPQDHEHEDFDEII
ncbi:cation:proton antiporter [Bacteroidales bacterium OttesenSCG-928-K03]|nr:cation:proton antiporter [Odoribacter sp. OttesenSCG-928-L07]MDL2239289.1 cation:proton antiporter [Bacteroidales bacterium OttesenSCG-928-L14]MDL2240676.1 cation:proton antiporter [Bacteroidales bacterium OttesenSCG-928-K22]MDL2242805.1 cation:proton antiporter [Bacteroidales bacterium OttesenSCG-928-K03]